MIQFIQGVQRYELRDKQIRNLNNKDSFSQHIYFLL